MMKKRPQAAGSPQKGGAVCSGFCTLNVARLGKPNRQTPQVESLQAAENKAQKFF